MNQDQAVNQSTNRGWYQRRFGWIPRPVRRVIVLVIGGTLMLLAVIGMILPIMPGVIFIPLALAIVALEFAWAARWLHKLKRTAGNVHQRIKDGVRGKPQPAPSASSTERPSVEQEKC